MRAYSMTPSTQAVENFIFGQEQSADMSLSHAPTMVTLPACKQPFIFVLLKNFYRVTCQFLLQTPGSFTNDAGAQELRVSF
jgi:hypothetical protein